MTKDFWPLLKNTISKRKSSAMAKGGIGSILLKLSRTFFGLIVGVVLARILGADEFGIYTYVFSIITLISLPAQFGLPQLMVRYIPKYEVEGEWAKIKGILNASNVFVILASILVIGISLALVQTGLLDVSSDKLNTFYWGLALVPAIALTSLKGATLRGFRHIILGLFPDNFIRHCAFVVALLVFSFIAKEWVTAETAMALNFLSVSLAFLIGAYWVSNKMPQQSKRIAPTYRLKEWGIVAVPLLLNGGMYLVNSKIDIILLGWYKNAEQVGIYEIGWRGASLVSFGLIALNGMLAPYISQLYHKNKIQKLQKIITISVVLNTLIALGVFCTYYLFGDYILSTVFGEEFTQGYTVLLILGGAHLVNVISGPSGIILNMTGYEKTVLWGLILSAIINIVFNFILIPEYGMEGAAIASLISYFIWNTFLVLMTLKKVEINSSLFSLISIIRK